MALAIATFSETVQALAKARHDTVKASMERLAERGTIELPPLVEISTATKPISEYLVNKRDSYKVLIITLRLP
jgi:anti-repressor protein